MFIDTLLIQSHSLAHSLVDILASSSPPHANDIIIGVDISRDRLNTCKSILKQVEDYYVSNFGPRQHPRHLLFEYDGQNYGKNILDMRGNLTYDSDFIRNELLHYGYHKKRNKSTRKREEIALRATEDEFLRGGIIDKCDEFDYVLCDVQCTHDYSYRHMIYNTDRGGEDTRNQGYKKVVITDNNDELESLQRQLLQNGFNLLKVGGSLVYSTCSEMERQNEAVVRWLLDNNSNAFVVPLVSSPTEALETSRCDILRDLDDAQLVAHVNGLTEEELQLTSIEISKEIACLPQLVPQSGKVPGTLRWSRCTYTSGLFIAKITKTIDI